MNSFHSLENKNYIKNQSPPPLKKSSTEVGGSGGWGDVGWVGSNLNLEISF